MRFRRIMGWMALAAFVSVLLALLYLKSFGDPVPLHMQIATILGVGFTVLVGTGLMGLVFLSSRSGHDEDATFGEWNDDGSDRPR
jgi:tetrahydromethanopterin S-methyltransferase subunit E